ncbi:MULTISPECIES: alpha/beta hydrolase [Idiomarina]|uniref:alpha/beta hydrolase n=1 Tax=Idiomarina TaxID=135575 RepID=UPI00241CE3C9|nr:MULTISPECIES: alpha/beta hydrolase [Idiomarina]|tara:strand:- start:3527 stop:4426 length:900 start_codon:yes stop_codon:yes gene_type:complete
MLVWSFTSFVTREYSGGIVVKVLFMLPKTLLLLLFIFSASNASANNEEPLKQVTFNKVLELAGEEPEKTYSYGAHPSQFIQYWNTHERTDSAANVIFIHGGCWLKDYDITHTNPASNALRNAGFNVWSIEYRRLGEEGGDWPASLNDVEAAIDFIGDKLNGRPSAVMGHSAGGHLALLATANDTPASPNINVVIGLAAITDMVSYTQTDGSCNRAALNLMKTAYENTSDYQKASPRTQKLHDNTWLIQGDADRIVPLSQTHNIDVETEILEGVGHFDLIHPHSSAWKAIIKRLNNELHP